MTAILPQGLINPSTVEQHSFEEWDAVVNNQDILRRFWRVYAIQSDASQDSASTRARNLFWRVWSSPKLVRSITSATLMTLLGRCGRDFDLTLIGNTVQMPPLQIHLHTEPSANVRAGAEVSPLTAPAPSQGSLVQDFMLPPAATPPQDPHRRQHQSAQMSSIVQHSDSTSGSTSNTTSESGSRPSLTRSASGGRQRLPVQATIGKSRTRPHLPRRKSSTPKSPSIPNPPKSPKGSPETARVGNRLRDPANTGLLRSAFKNPPPGPANVSLTSSGNAFALPSASSWQSVESAAEPQVVAATAPQPILGDLVDPGFRGKFVETQKNLSSVTNLAALGRVRKSVSTVRFADEAPEDKRKGKEKEVISPLRNEQAGSSHPKPRVTRDSRSYVQGSGDSSSTDDDDDDDAPMELPRTKSQLSLLIQHKRSQTGSQDLGPQSPTEGRGKSDARDQSREEELLSMGRRDGVTKAGGVQTPKQQRVIGRNEPDDISSSSPEPLF